MKKFNSTVLDALNLADSQSSIYRKLTEERLQSSKREKYIAEAHSVVKSNLKAIINSQKEVIKTQLDSINILTLELDYLRIKLEAEKNKSRSLSTRDLILSEKLVNFANYILELENTVESLQKERLQFFESTLISNLDTEDRQSQESNSTEEDFF